MSVPLVVTASEPEQRKCALLLNSKIMRRLVHRARSLTLPSAETTT